MKFNFKKVASVIASAVMLTSTVGFAAASTYPAPFTSGAAVVYGSGAASSDMAAAIDVYSSLNGQTTSTTTTTTASTSGEAAALFTSGSLLYLNDSLNNVKSTLTKSELPTVLADNTFSGNVDAKIVQSIIIGSNPLLTFDKQPTSTDDPQTTLKMSTSQTNYIYNATTDFGKAVNFTHADSKNQELILFGQKFTVGASTTTTDLILLKSASKVDLDSSGTTSQEVEVAGKKYTVELVSASTSAATIKVTNEAGATEQKEVNEGYSKKINGVTIAVNTADSNNLKYTASVVAGSEKVTLTSGSAVKIGESDTIVDGTLVTITGGIGAMTKLVVSVYAPESDKDAIVPGKAFVDPVFGSFKLDFAGLNIADNSETARETIAFTTSGDNKLLVSLKDHRGNEKNLQWAINNTDKVYLQWDDQGHNIAVTEMAAVNKSDYVILGNEDEGRLLKVTTIYNSSSTTASDDKVEFQDVFSGDTITTSITTEGTGTVQVGGKSYTVTYWNVTSDSADTSRQIRINSPDSSAEDMIIFPTIQTSKGAKIMFYKPLLSFRINNWESTSTTGTTTNLTGDNIKVPNGARAYQSIAIGDSPVNGGVTIDSNTLNATTAARNVTITNTGLKLAFVHAPGTSFINDTISVYLTSPEGPYITDPALILIEEKDDNNQYQAVITTIRPGATSTTGIGIDDFKRTYAGDSLNDGVSLYSNSYKTREMDLWGTIALKDTTSSSHPVGTLSYPDQQVYGQIYVAAEGAVITPGTTGGSVTTGAINIVKDTEVSSVSTKNLIVVGGSCVNAVAAKVLGSTVELCGADFTAKTKVGAGQYIIKTVASPYAEGKIAMLVAGYEAEQTTLAAKKVLEGVDSTVDTEQVYPIVTAA